MKLFSLTCAALPVLAVALLTGAVHGETTPPKTVKTNLPEPDVTAAWLRRVAEFNIDGLPLSEVVKGLRQQFPEINFIIKGDDDNSLDNLSIRATWKLLTLDEILNGLQLAYEDQLHVRYGSAPKDQIGHAEKERFVVFERPHRQGMTGNEVITRTYNLSRYLERASADESDRAMVDLESVIRQAADMTEAAAKGGRHLQPKLSLHRGTKLLIAVGRPEEMILVDGIVRELQSGGSPIKVNAAPGSAKQ